MHCVTKKQHDVKNDAVNVIIIITIIQNIIRFLVQTIRLAEDVKMLTKKQDTIDETDMVILICHHH